VDISVISGEYILLLSSRVGLLFILPLSLILHPIKIRKAKALNDIAIEHRRSNSAKTKRENLFSLYAENLSIYFPNIEGKFLCPVCKVLYSHNDLTCNPPRIALAHIIPKSVGGRTLTLACGTCDNRIGSEFDKHRDLEKKSIKYKEKNIGRYGYIKYEDRRIGVLLSGSLFGYKGDAGLVIKPPPNIPLDYWQKCINEIMPNKKISFETKTHDFDSQRRNISYIYSAFLAMFSTFGYEYILSPNVQTIRKTICGEPNSLDIKSILCNLPIEDIPESSPSISILNEPREIRSFFVALPSSNDKRAMCVFLPGFGEDGKMSYENLQKFTRTHKELNPKFKLIPKDSKWPNLSDINHKWFGNWMWDELGKSS
jgi:hypothetical protein